MARRTYHVSATVGDRTLSLAFGLAVAVALFVVMALAQMIGKVKPPQTELVEQAAAFVPPEVEEIEQEEPPPEKEEEPPPDKLEEEPPQLSLDQLDIALNPGTGGSLAGDFAMPVVATSQHDLGTEDFVDFSDLDQIPRPIGASLNFPARLRRKAVSGRIVLLLKLDETGRVVHVEVESSDLPAFDDFVRNAVETWKFTPPTQQGRPVKAKARFPLPIDIR